MSSVFSPVRQASLMLLSLNNNCPSTAPFQSPIQVNSTSIEQNVSIQENLNVTTVEPRLTATPLIRSPCYYGHIFLARQNGHTFAYKKTPLMRSPVNTANGHFFKFPTHTILYNLTPLMRPLEKTKTTFSFNDLSFTYQTAGF